MSALDVPITRPHGGPSPNSFGPLGLVRPPKKAKNSGCFLRANTTLPLFYQFGCGMVRAPKFPAPGFRARLSEPKFRRGPTPPKKKQPWPLMMGFPDGTKCSDPLTADNRGNGRIGPGETSNSGCWSKFFTNEPMRRRGGPDGFYSAGRPVCTAHAEKGPSHGFS